MFGEWVTAGSILVNGKWNHFNRCQMKHWPPLCGASDVVCASNSPFYTGKWANGRNSKAQTPASGLNHWSQVHTIILSCHFLSVHCTTRCHGYQLRHQINIQWKSRNNSLVPLHRECWVPGSIPDAVHDIDCRRRDGGRSNDVTLHGPCQPLPSEQYRLEPASTQLTRKWYSTNRLSKPGWTITWHMGLNLLDYFRFCKE